jgi:hypothetical protein
MALLLIKIQKPVISYKRNGRYMSSIQSSWHVFLVSAKCGTWVRSDLNQTTSISRQSVKVINPLNKPKWLDQLSRDFTIGVAWCSSGPNVGECIGISWYLSGLARVQISAREVRHRLETQRVLASLDMCPLSCISYLQGVLDWDYGPLR